jgi:hypothetical protein
MTVHHSSDDAVRLAIGTLRVDEELHTPSFDMVRSRRPLRRPVGVSVTRLLAVATIAGIAAIGLHRAMTARTSSLVVPDDVRLLSTWRPATDGFLETPGSAMLRISPRLGASLIDIPFNGVSR